MDCHAQIFRRSVRITAMKTMALHGKISMDQFIRSAVAENSAVAEKVVSLESENYLKERGKLGSRDAYLKVLDKVPAD